MQLKNRLMHLGETYNLLIHFSVNVCMRETLTAAVYTEVESVTNAPMNVYLHGETPGNT